ncbi:MAG: TIM barrel protein [Candidatus Hadarchaeota archaeon]|nr:TIM barrel protein [Candidatus Hadarchaeota archaeon]
MIYIGPAGIPLKAKGQGTVKGVETIAELGLNAMEIQFVRGVRMKPEQAEEVKRVAQKRGVKLSVHAPYYINFCSPKEETIRKSRERLKRSADMAKILGSDTVTFHAGFYGDYSSEKAIGEVIKNLQKIRFPRGVRAGIETMGRQKQFGTLDEVLAVADATGHRPVLDFAHIHARGDGCLRKKDDFLGVLKLMKKSLGTDIIKNVHTHFTGIEYSKGNERKHLTLEEGDLRFGPLVQAFVEMKLEPTVICESPILEGDALKMMEMARKLA